MEYFNPMGSNWTKRVKPHLADVELNRVFVEDFNKYTFGRRGLICPAARGSVAKRNGSIRARTPGGSRESEGGAYNRPEKTPPAPEP
jgi:hypothetical protein